MPVQTDEQLKSLLLETRSIAVVGLSDKEHRSSYGVAQYLTKYYTIVPVNPRIETWKGLKSYPSLLDIPPDIHIDMVDVFRRSEEVSAIVDEAIERGVRSLWLQLGVVNEEACVRAESAGLQVVMDSCIAVVHSTLVRG